MSVSDASVSVSDEGEWLDLESDEETIAITSLFDAKTFPTAQAMLDHCKQAHAFDLAAVLQRLNLDFHGAIKLVNFIRHSVKQDTPLPKEITTKDFEDDKFLQPVLEDDALLFSLDDILEAEGDAPADSKLKDTSSDEVLVRNKDLEEELEKVRSQFANYRLAVQETLDKRWGDDKDIDESSAPKKDNSNYYFESYAQNDIHETMLKDAVRTDAYRDFIYGNKHIFKDKVVLDIGCGTGILSMFCAKAGAKQVIAVDRSDIIEKARENIFNNGLSKVITCVKGAIEEVVLPVKEVDIIVSEWMGYFLLYEAMLPSVLYARDKYLKPDGLLAPSSCTLWIAPIADQEYIADHISFWRDVYGFDMKAMQEGIYDDARVETTPKNLLCGEPCPFKVLDLHTIKTEELVFTSPWTSELNREVDSVDGFLIWFDNFFTTSRSEPVPPPETTPDNWKGKSEGAVAFTTGPFHTETHWRQGLLLATPQEKQTKLAPPYKLSGDITYATADDNKRALTLDASWAGPDGVSRKQHWKMK